MNSALSIINFTKKIIVKISSRDYFLKLNLRMEEFERDEAELRANNNWLNVFESDIITFKELRNFEIIKRKEEFFMECF